MSKRWIIRGIFIGLLMLNIVGWVWSSVYNGRVGYIKSGYGVAVGTTSGCLFLNYYPYNPAFLTNSSLGHWGYSMMPLEMVNVWPGPYFGFYYFAKPYMKSIQVPYWFLILLCSAMLYWVWRKTGQKKSSTAFQVVVRDVRE